MMTENQKKKIENLRTEGYTYKAISEALGLSFDAVKCYCRRIKLKSSGHKKGIDVCKECGEVLHHVSGRRKKTFCSSKCRIAWWNKHRQQLNMKSGTEVVCRQCGKTFIAYDSENRKYCSALCYGRARSIQWKEQLQ